MKELKAIWVDIDLTKLGKEAKHLFRTSEKNGHKYITLTLSPRKEAPSWNEHEVYSLAAYDKDAEDKTIYVGNGQIAIWDREKQEKQDDEEKPIVGVEEKDDDLPF